MATGFVLPPPSSLEIHDANAADKWKKFLTAWENYSLATKLNKQDEAIQVATLLTVIGEEARDVFSTFQFDGEEDKAKIKPVLTKFGEYCEPRRNIPFERYLFNKRVQEPGETYEQYRTELRKIAEGCEFDKITPDEILRDRLVFGIRDSKVRERLLRETKLTLQRTDEICRASESMQKQMKVVGEKSDVPVNAVSKGKFQYKKKDKSNVANKQTKECGNCGQRHDMSRKENCPAHLKECRKCGKLSHFARKCRSSKRDNRVKAIVEDSSGDECLGVTSSGLDDSQPVTLKLESGNYLRFQPDTGAQCNTIPLTLYKQATGDVKLKHVEKAKTKLSAYGGANLNVVGKVKLRVWRDDFRCKLDCKIVDNKGIRPLLGRKVCIGMNIIKYMDNDEIRKPLTGSTNVYVVGDRETVTKETLLQKFPDVFSEEVGMMEGEHNIRIDKNVDPVQHAPRRVPVALRAKVKEALQSLEKQEIITSVTTPTPWISSVVAIPKANKNKLRICLDPRDLNRAVQRENYPLPTIEDIATRLHGAKVFTKLDVRNGFWHVKLNEESSYLTTFNTPFGRYRWQRLPFGISSAPEVFQRKMHELIEGLKGIEVVADDFIVVGYVDTMEEANRNHDNTLMAFLERCRERNVKLNIDKLTLREREVPFIGHVATDKGLRVDPAKVRAITEMPAPTDKAGVQRLLGLAQYLSKFLPRLSDITKPLRELTQNDVQWFRGDAQQASLDSLKKAVTQTPVLRYYNLEEEVTIQCDASSTGVAAALLQGGQPVAYCSRAMTPAETRYAQIEKELLAIVFAVERFEPYVYGRDKVTMESDYKPLQFIFQKPLHAVPKRLQRMLLRLQKYSLHVHYKKGKEMYLADTLSRAYLRVRPRH